MENKTKNKITKEKLNKYFALTGKALKEIKSHVIKGKESEARQIIEMASNYFSDAEHFQNKSDFINAFAALNYAHGWIDSGARLGIFDVHDEKLFTVK